MDERRECLPGISVQAGELTALSAVQQESGCSGLWKCAFHWAWQRTKASYHRRVGFCHILHVLAHHFGYDCLWVVVLCLGRYCADDGL